MHQSGPPTWPRLTLYVSVLETSESEEDREIRAVVVTPQRTVLWADAIRGASSELEEWAAERLVSGVLPGAPRLQQLPPFRADRVEACRCGMIRFPTGQTRGVCPRCDRDEQATAYAAAMAYRVQSDYMVDLPPPPEPIEPISPETVRATELNLPSPIRASYLMARGTLQDAQWLARASAQSDGETADVSRITAYCLTLQLRRWLSAPAEMWLQTGADSMDAECPDPSGALPSWEAFAALPPAEQHRHLTHVLDVVSQAVQAWGQNPEEPPPALADPGAPVARAEESSEAPTIALPDSVRKALVAALLTMGMTISDPVEAFDPASLPPALDRTLDDVAMRRLPALRVMGSDFSLVQAVTRALTARGIRVVPQFTLDDTTGVGTLSVMPEAGGGYTMTLKNPKEQILLRATIDRSGKQAQVTQSSMRPVAPVPADLPVAVTAEGVLDRWVQDVVRAYPPATQQVVTVGPLTWPSASIGGSRLSGPDQVKRAFVARLKRQGYTVKSRVASGIPVIMGGLWDASWGSDAFVWAVEADGRVRSLGTVAVPETGWVDESLGDPASALLYWIEPLRDGIGSMAKTVKQGGVTEVGLPVRIIDPDDQLVPMQSETLRRMAWPLLIRAMEQAGVTVYQVGREHRPSAHLTMQVDWRFVKDAQVRTVLSEVLVTFGLETVHPQEQLLGGLWTVRLPWPQAVLPVETVKALPRSSLAVPVEWEPPKSDEDPFGLSMPNYAQFPTHFPGEDPDAFEKRAEAFRKKMIADSKREGQRMVEEHLRDITEYHQKVVEKEQRVWEQSPSQEVPRNIRKGVEEMRRFRRKLPGGAILEEYEQKFRSFPYERPYPKG